MNNFLHRTWCEINLDDLHYNINLINRLSEKKVIAVVKANAYGHGDFMIARELQSCGVDFFAVSNIEEALLLRKAEITGEILILGYTPADEVKRLFDYNITQAVFDLDYAKELNSALINTGKKIKVHIKVDTGMNRIGFMQNTFCDSFEEIISVTKLQNLIIEGIFTHLCVADSDSKDDIIYTKHQLDNLDKLVERLNKNGVNFKFIHAQNSAGLITLKDDTFNAVRAGIVLYGLSPSPEYKDKADFKPIMSLKSTVSQVKTIPKGSFISYGRTFVSEREMTVATVAAGYADGYYRALSSKADVLINGVRCKVLGRVCMDQLIVDVSGVKDVKRGVTVTLFGKDKNECITLDELATLSDTINYEIACNINRRVPRVYIKNGEIVKVIDYQGVY